MESKKRLSYIPANYVSLLHLQERWNKEKERDQKAKEEKQQSQQQQEEKENETNVEERVNEEVSGRGSRKNRRFPRDNGKRVAEWKPRDEKTAFAAEDMDNEKKAEDLKKKKNDRLKTVKEKKRNKMEEKARAANEGENTGNASLPTSRERDKGQEELIGSEVHAPELASGKEEKFEARWEPRRRSIPEKNRRKAEIERKSQETERNTREIGDEVHAPKPASVEEENVEAIRKSRPRSITRNHGRMAEIGRKFQATERSKGEKEPIRDEVHAPMLESVKEVKVESRREPRFNPRTNGRTAEVGRKFQATKCSKGEEQLIRDEVHAPMPPSVKDENVEARREPRFNPRTHGRTVEIGRKFQAMSVNGEMRRSWDNRGYHRRNYNLNQRDGNRRKEGMVWVKKGEVVDQYASGAQTSSNELD